MAGPIRIAVLADAGQARRELGAVANDTSSLGASLGKFSKAAGVAVVAGLAVAGAAAVKFGVDSVKAASDAQQSIGATETVFGKSAQAIIENSDRAARAVGLSANQYRENANLIGSLFANKGLKGNELAKQTDLVIKKGADLSATFGGSATEAVEALSSALKGEFDPLERYGISLKASTISAEAAALAQKQYGRDLDKLSTAQQNSIQRQAAMNLINEQSAKSQGAFSRETNTLAHQQQVLGAQFDNIKAKVGAALLPVLTSLAATFNTVILPAVSNFIAGMKSGEGAGGTFAAVMTTIGSVIATVAGFVADNGAAFGAFAATIGVVVGVVKAWSIAQAILNATLLANPIGLAVLAIAALAAGLTMAYQRSETFRNIVNAAFSAIRSVVGAVVDWFAKYVPQVFSAVVTAVRTYVTVYRTVVTTAFNVVKTVVTAAVNAVRAVVTTVWNAIRSATAAVWTAITGIVRGAVNGVTAAINGIAALVGKVRGWFGDVLEAIRSKLTDAVAFVKGIPNKIVGALSGLGARLYNAGAEAMKMLAQGIKDKADAAWQAMKNAAGKLAGLIPGSPVKEGPLKSLNNGHSGGQMMHMLAKGIADNDEKPADAMRKAMEKVRGRLEEKRDEIKGVLDGLKSDFRSLSDSVAQAFTGNLFDVSATEGIAIENGASFESAAEALAAYKKSLGTSAGTNFIQSLMGTRSELRGLMAAFKRLVKWGLSPQFLSQLFASGNGGLILDLAGNRSQARQAELLFGQVDALSSKLGNRVARSDLGPKVDRTNAKLNEIVKELKNLSKRDSARRATAHQAPGSTTARASSSRTAGDTALLLELRKQNVLLEKLVRIEADAPIAFGREINGASKDAKRRGTR